MSIAVHDVRAESRNLAAVAHLLGLFTSALGPLLVYVLKRDDPFVAYHAIQAMIFQAVATVVSGAFVGITFGIGLPVVILFWIGAVMWAMKAQDGQWSGYPGIEEIGRPRA